MTNPAWKRTERSIATIIGGQRVPVTGRGRGDAPDIDHPRLALEVKHRRTLPAWLLDAMNQATTSSRDGRIPTVVLHRHGARHADDLCVLRLSDLVALVIATKDTVPY